MIDVTHNFYDDVKDIPKDKPHDPDAKSRKLRDYHRLLWHKEVPNFHLPNRMFELDANLNCKNFNLRFGVDCFLNLYIDNDWQSIKEIVDKAYENDKENRDQEPPYTIGASLIFPKVGVHSLNSRRGFHPKVRDRIDLTLECIRRYYANEHSSPLEKHMQANKKFFDLFVNFKQYIEFFLLQDFVSKDFKTVNFLLPFDDFKSDGYPKNLQEWEALRYTLTRLINARNKRIDDYCRLNNI